MVLRRTRVYRAEFRKLSPGDVYYENIGGSGPFVKAGPRTALPSDSPPSDPGWIADPVTDISVVVQRVPGYLLGSNRVY